MEVASRESKNSMPNTSSLPERESNYSLIKAHLLNMTSLSLTGATILAWKRKRSTVMVS